MRQPVVRPDEIVIGRTHTEGMVWLLTHAERLVRLSVAGRTSMAFRVDGLREGDQLWGLAWTEDGTLLTMLGPSTFAELTRTGRVGHRWSLPRQYVGLYGAPTGILLQPVSFDVGRPALEWARGPTTTRRAVGTLTVMPASSRVETMTRNLIGCGMTRTHEVPCWFNHDTRLHRVALREPGRVVDLGVLWSEPDQGAGPVDEGGPIVDAQIAEDHSLWVLLREPGLEAPVLVRFDARGVQTADPRVDLDARLILAARPDRVLLLSRQGHPVEVFAP